MKKYIKHLPIYLFVLGVVLTSCDSKKVVESDTVVEKTNSVEMTPNDSTKIFIDVLKVDSMTVILDNDLKNNIGQSDFALLADALSTAEYDIRLNSGDIMMKMQAPDYTVIVYNTGKSDEDSDWLMIWKEDGRTKFKNKWFYLAADKKEVTYKLLDKYKEKSK